MHVKAQSNVFYIDDKNAEYSPYLKALMTTKLSIDKEGDVIVLDVDYNALQEYIKFLQGYDFNMNEEIEALFDYMGHHNTYRYPLDFWKVKLRDTWIRDNFYRLSLYNDPYYGLTKIPYNKERLVKQVHDLPKGHYLAGGYVLYLADITVKYKDIDVFTTDPKVSEEVFGKYMNYGSENAVDILYDRQLILRVYSCPSEIVHGFDVGCCGVLFDGKDVWATERALYCINNKVNWLEPDRASPSYIYRLCKYANRSMDIELNKGGFRIMLPLSDEIKINKQYKAELQEACKKIIFNGHAYVHQFYACNEYEINLEEARNMLCKYTHFTPSEIDDIINESYPDVGDTIKINNDFTNEIECLLTRFIYVRYLNYIAFAADNRFVTTKNKYRKYSPEIWHHCLFFKQSLVLITLIYLNLLVIMLVN